MKGVADNIHQRFSFIANVVVDADHNLMIIEMSPAYDKPENISRILTYDYQSAGWNLDFERLRREDTEDSKPYVLPSLEMKAAKEEPMTGRPVESVPIKRKKRKKPKPQEDNGEVREIAKPGMKGSERERSITIIDERPPSMRPRRSGGISAGDVPRIEKRRRKLVSDGERAIPAKFRIIPPEAQRNVEDAAMIDELERLRIQEVSQMPLPPSKAEPVRDVFLKERRVEEEVEQREEEGPVGEDVRVPRKPGERKRTRFFVRDI